MYDEDSCVRVGGSVRVGCTGDGGIPLVIGWAAIAAVVCVASRRLAG